MKAAPADWDISAGFWFSAAFLILVMPVSWITAAAAAAGIHELAHIVVIRALGGRVYRITLHPGGAEIAVSGLGYLQEMAAAAAGPLASLLLTFSCRAAPRLAVCGLLQGLLNLLPLYPLDGGRILLCGLIRAFGNERGDAIFSAVSGFLLSGLGVLGILSYIYSGFSLVLLVITTGILIKAKNSLQCHGQGSTIG